MSSELDKVAGGGTAIVGVGGVIIVCKSILNLSITSGELYLQPNNQWREESNSEPDNIQTTFSWCRSWCQQRNHDDRSSTS